MFTETSGECNTGIKTSNLNPTLQTSTQHGGTEGTEDTEKYKNGREKEGCRGGQLRTTSAKT
jgi:hypothetical protein